MYKLKNNNTNTNKITKTKKNNMENINIKNWFKTLIKTIIVF